MTNLVLLVIGWITNTKFDGVDNQHLFNEHFHPQIIREQGGENFKTTDIRMQALK